MADPQPSSRARVVRHGLALAGIALVLGCIGLASVRLGQPLLVPSLGSAIFVQALTPEQPTARLWNTAVGQLAGAAAGFAGILLTASAGSAPFMDGGPLHLARVGAAAVASLLTAGLQLMLGATSPAGGATALVVALGAETATWSGAARLVAGILLVSALGEAVRRLLLEVG